MNAKAKSAATDSKAAEKPAAIRVPPESCVTLDENGDEENTIRISENVIAAIVRRYVLEVSGVVRFANPSIVGGLAEMIGRRTNEGSVVVDLEGDAVNIAVNLVMAFGVRIPEVAALVQDVVRTRIEELTGKHVARVNVTVQDLEALPEPREAPDMDALS